MTIRILGPVLAFAALLAACGGGNSSTTPTPVPTATRPAATATATVVPTDTQAPTSTPVPSGTALPTSTSAPTHTPLPTDTAVPTQTGVPTGTPIATDTAAPTATPTVDHGAACGDGAAAALRTCVASISDALRGCYLSLGTTCGDGDDSADAALSKVDAAVRAACPADASVHAAGFNPELTVAALVGRMQAACGAEGQSLASRAFGGPQGAALSGADEAARACLTTAHADAASLVDEQLGLYDACLAAARDGGACDPAATAAAADAARDQVALAVGTACASLPALVSVDPPTFAARAAAQARCLTAMGHADTAPLALDCGPRDGLVAAPRGEYVQVVLDSDTYGTRCGDGSPFAFWIRLAPEGAPVDRVVVGMQGGGVCIFGSDCATRPADLFEALSDQPETGGTLSNDPQINPYFADWTKVYLPYCNQDVFIGGGTTSNFPEVTVHRYGAVNVRAAMRYVRDLIWRELDRDTAQGYRPDEVRALFGGFSAGAFGTIYNYHWVLDDLLWARTAAYPDAGLALDNGQALGVRALGALLINDTPPLGWGARNYMPSYCTTTDCGVGPVILEHMAPRLLSVPEQQILVLSNQVDETQVATTFFSSTADWVNALRASYCATRDLPGVSYFMPAIAQNIHVISPRPELYTNYPIDGVLMRDWLASAFTDPEAVTNHVEEGTLVNDYPGVMPFGCDVP
ncbi:hypothetical protein KF840_05560 [bacterium]|nr:hypothetical protein [bacterium]